jgi:ParB family transcriptional regulator, chromosome partitioning protein
MKARINEIIVKKRIRRDIGDISDLMESISKFGLLNPITVTERMELIAGYRRLEASRALGLEEIEYRIVPVQSTIDMLLIEADENITRKDLTAREIQHYEDEKRYLQARGLEKVRLWFIRIYKMIKEWIRRFILRRES